MLRNAATAGRSFTQQLVNPGHAHQYVSSTCVGQMTSLPSADLLW